MVLRWTRSREFGDGVGAEVLFYKALVDTD
jgi:hypothetical protein